MGKFAIEWSLKWTECGHHLGEKNKKEQQGPYSGFIHFISKKWILKSIFEVLSNIISNVDFFYNC